MTDAKGAHPKSMPHDEAVARVANGEADDLYVDLAAVQAHLAPEEFVLLRIALHADFIAVRWYGEGEPPASFRDADFPNVGINLGQLARFLIALNVIPMSATRH